MSGFLLVLGYTLRTVSLDPIRASAGPLRGIPFGPSFQPLATTFHWGRSPKDTRVASRDPAGALTRVKGREIP